MSSSPRRGHPALGRFDPRDLQGVWHDLARFGIAWWAVCGVLGAITDVKTELHESLRAARDANLLRASGLSEYDLLRPLTPSGTNVLGVLKHLGGMEYGYLGGAFGRPLDREIPGDEDLWGGADLWVRPDESASYILDWYHQACTNADETIALHDLDSPGWVEHFTEGHQTTTLGTMMIRVLTEECRHGGHLDIVRELVDGDVAPWGARTGDDRHAYLTRVHTAASPFVPPPKTPTDHKPRHHSALPRSSADPTDLLLDD